MTMKQKMIQLKTAEQNHKTQRVIKNAVVLCCLTLPTLALANATQSPSIIAGVSIPNTAPAWVATGVAVFMSLCGLIAHLDAQIPEDFKQKWPWWLRLFWDLGAGNYKCSQNQASIGTATHATDDNTDVAGA